MPLRNQDKYLIHVENEPPEAYEIRKKILETFDGLEFIDEGHKYFLNNIELQSVSNVVSAFESEFDTERKAIEYAEKNGETPEYWKDIWKFKNLKATTTGTAVHSYAESLAWLHVGYTENITDDNKYKYISDKGWLIPTRPKEDSALNFWNNLPENLYVVLPETRVFNIGDKLKYAGTFDLLCYYDSPTDKSKSGLIVFDYKTNADLYKDFSRTHNKKLKQPFEDLFDEPYGGYTIQLSLYTIALEKIGLKTIGRRLIWLKEDGTYEIIPTKYMKNELLSIDNTLV